MEKKDCIVIGAGIIGMTTARELSKQGLTVGVLDKGSFGGEASWAAGGILSSMRPWSENSGSLALSVQGKACYEQFAEELKVQTNIDTEYHRSGLLMINKSDVTQSKVWAETNAIAFSDSYNRYPTGMRLIDKSIFFPEIAQVRVPYLLKALRTSLIKENVAIYENTLVSEFEMKADRCISVKAGTNRFYADKFIVTAGAWTTQLLEKNRGSLSIKPVLGQMLCVKFSKQQLQTMILDGASYLIPRLDGHVLIGSTMEDVGFNKTTTSDARKKLMDWAISLWPDISKAEFVKHWAGLRPATEQSEPYLGKLSGYENVFINAGHFRKGILQAPVCARKIVEMVRQ